MEKPDLNREMALRIGLAARALPDTQLRSFMTVLLECTGLPLTEASVALLDAGRFDLAFRQHGRHFKAAVLERALRMLKTPLSADPSIPDYRGENGADLPGSIRIAIGSQDGLHVDGHFSSCQRFMIYQVSAHAIRPVAVRPIDLEKAGDYSDKNEYRADLIADCQILHIASIGGAAATKIVKKGVHLIKIGNDKTLSAVLEQLQNILAESPPPWLAKIMGMETVQRCRFQAQESVS